MEAVLVDGRVLVRDGTFLAIDDDEVIERAAVAGVAAWDPFLGRSGAYTA